MSEEKRDHAEDEKPLGCLLGCEHGVFLCDRLSEFTGKRYFWVRCPTCNIESAEYLLPRLAVAAWNAFIRRATSRIEKYQKLCEDAQAHALYAQEITMKTQKQLDEATVRGQPESRLASAEEVTQSKPPLGAVPRYIHKSLRIAELSSAIHRQIDAGREQCASRVLLEWCTELAELLELGGESND